MKLNTKRGISLIVLVITIIVMIILAAAIILSLQSSGIIGRANEAKVKNDIASAKELVAIANSEWLLMTESDQESNGGSFVSYAENKLLEAKYNPDELVIHEDGTAEECEAMIAGEKFSTVNKAIDKAYDDEMAVTIKIMKDINVDVTIETYRNQEDITIDLNGYTLSSVGVDIIRNNRGTVLNIVDTSEAKTGKIIAKSDKSKYVEKYDVNKDGVVAEEDYRPLANHFAKSEIIEEGTEEYEFYDVNNDGTLTGADLSMYVGFKNQAYAIINLSGELHISVSEDKITGEPAAIDSEEVIWEN